MSAKKKLYTFLLAASLCLVGAAFLLRACLKSGGVPDWGGFFCRARRFDAGILADFKSNQRSTGGKRCPETAFQWILNRL